MSTTTWNEKFDLSDVLYSISNIQYYFELILKKRIVNIVNNAYQRDVRVLYLFVPNTSFS